MNTDALAKQITGTLTWIITHPFAALLWVSAIIITIGLGFGMLNQAFPLRLPTFGINAQTAIYPAGVIYLLWGKV